MEERNLGKSGLRVSLVGLGCNNFGGRIDLEATRKVVHKAFDCGITLFDTADTYGERGGSETCLGQILGDRRKDIVLATKFGMPMDDAGRMKGGSRRYIMSAVEASLKRLNTDWIDLYQLHQYDPLTPIEETLRALDDLVHQGKVRHIGCSNLPSWRVVEAQWTARVEHLGAFISCQDEYSLLVREIEKDLLPAMEAYGMSLLALFPVGERAAHRQIQARRPDAPRRAAEHHAAPGRPLYDGGELAVVEGLRDLAGKRGWSMLDLAFSWLATKPVVASVIAGATKPEQIEQNVKAVELKLSAEDLSAIEEVKAHAKAG